MKYLMICFVVGFALSASAESVPFISAKREFYQPYQYAMAESLSKHPSVKSLVYENSPHQLVVSFDDISFENVPQVDSYDDLITVFNYVRDNRFMYVNNEQYFTRRISWLYPDDGCFARAAAIEYLFHNKMQISPAKIFAIGDLTVQTPYSLYGEVSWWYHVAPIVAYQNQYYVLDPAIQPFHPMLVEDWFATMNPHYREELKGIVCHPQTYNVVDDCLEPDNSEQKGLADEKCYLKYEWQRIENLGFDPITILGDSPPWDNIAIIGQN